MSSCQALYIQAGCIALHDGIADLAGIACMDGPARPAHGCAAIEDSRRPCCCCEMQQTTETNTSVNKSRPSVPNTTHITINNIFSLEFSAEFSGLVTFDLERTGYRMASSSTQSAPEKTKFSKRV